MLQAQRHQEILDLLGQQSTLVVHRVAQHLGVAESTIRRDLEALEAQGLLKRTHGGAVLPNGNHRQPLALLERAISFEQEKDRIGRAAAALVGDNEAIFLDSGTTTQAMVPYLLRRKGLTVVTCGLGIAARLAAAEDISTIVVGGELHVPTLSFVGSLAQRAIELYDLYFTKSFIGARGVSAEYGITNRASERIPMKRLAIERAREVIVLADGSKIGTLAPFQVAPITAMQHLITDLSAPLSEREAIMAKGIWVTAV